MSLYRLSIVLAINGIYTKPRIFGHRPVCRLSIISPIVISKLSFASVYGTICTKSVVIAYKNSYKQPLYFGIPGVLGTRNGLPQPSLYYPSQTREHVCGWDYSWPSGADSH